MGQGQNLRTTAHRTGWDKLWLSGQSQPTYPVSVSKVLLEHSYTYLFLSSMGAFVLNSRVE